MYQQVGIHKLQDRTSKIMQQVKEGGVRYVITEQGHPSALLVPVDSQILDEETVPSTTITDAIPMLTEPFVQTGLYTNSSSALKYIVMDYLDRQIHQAQIEIENYEHKYQQSFVEWSESISGRATIDEEDDWMEWEAARDMLSGWQQIRVEIEQSDV